MNTSPPRALEGLKVLDLSRVLAGPYCSMLLGDMGADVLKVERPGAGDDTRHWGPPWQGEFSAYFLSVNRNKRSLTLDLKHPRGLEILKRLLLQADVLLENFRVGTLDKLGLTQEWLQEHCPSLIICRFSGYGQEGPNAQRPGYDFAIQAEAGVMSITGPGEGAPHKVGVAVVDVTAGLYASQAILGALLYRERSGRGQEIDVSLWDAQLGWLVNVAQNALVTGNIPGRFGNEHPTIVPYQTFETATEPFALAVGNDRQYQRLCALLQAPELWNDERFQTNAGRVEHRKALIPMLQAVFVRRSREEWLASIQEAGIPCAPIQNIQEALTSEQSRARGSVLSITHPDAGDILQVAPVARMSETPPSLRLPPPALGEHSRQVLEEWLALSENEWLELQALKVV